jgi:hypothetical protein
MFAPWLAAVLYQFDAHDQRRFLVMGLRRLRAGLLYWLAAAACLTGQIRCANPNQLHSLAWHLSLLLLGLLGGMIAGVIVSIRLKAVTGEHVETK